ncbi:MAG TPA: twin-arginine translocase subunit TatC [Bryobacteraceae bacterium]|jgi:sec-independent protein translocase protein TatC|nr:twin-arginine translocase subunit TatC [Bryobacteraceae bacterium]
MDEPKGGELSPKPPVTSVVPAGGGTRTPPPPPPADEEEDADERGMLRMSFLEHLEELRSRLIKMLAGLAVAFALSFGFSKPLWTVISTPAIDALTKLGIKNPHLVAIEPLEQMTIIWFKLPIVVALFVGSPWILYQIWAFIAPGLYKRERRWAIPFVLTTAGLFILGGLFAYFVAFRLGLTFLLGVGLDVGVEPMVTITSYFDIFVDVILGVALVFELPIVIFFLILLRIVTPSWLMANSRYAILGIVILAAAVTPTTDAFTMMLVVVPMCALYFVGVFAGYLLVLRREGQRFPWLKVLGVIGVLLLIGAGIVWLMITRYHFHLIRHWPFLTK